MQARAPSAPALHSTGPSPKETVSREVIEKTLEIRMGAWSMGGSAKERSLNLMKPPAWQRKDLEAFPKNQFDSLFSFL